MALSTWRSATHRGLLLSRAFAIARHCLAAKGLRTWRAAADAAARVELAAWRCGAAMLRACRHALRRGLADWVAANLFLRQLAEVDAARRGGEEKLADLVERQVGRGEW